VDPAQRRIDFHQTELQLPLVRLGGEWAISDVGGRSLASLTHEYAVGALDGELAERISQLIGENSMRELEALKLTCERLNTLVRQHSGELPASARALTTMNSQAGP
jgi:aromatase/bifunctional cyclase/aromatase